MKSWEGSAGPFIYKYVSFNPNDDLSVKKLENIVVESQIYFSAPSDFNDPFELKASVSLSSDPVARRRYIETSAKKAARRRPDGRKASRKYISHLVSRASQRAIVDPGSATAAHESMASRVGLSCFSLNPRQLTMWSHYAGSHSGVCLQFDVARDLGMLAVAHPVNYSDDFPTLVWPDDRENIMNHVVLRKGLAWEQEEEVRCVSLTTSHDSLPFSPDALSGLILGTRFPGEHEAALSRMLERRRFRGMPSPKIYRASCSKSAYRVIVAREHSIGGRKADNY